MPIVDAKSKGRMCVEGYGILSKEVMTKTVINGLRIGLAIDTTDDPMILDKNSKECIGNSSSCLVVVVNSMQ